MLTINDIKVGTVIMWRDQPHETIFAQHTKMGRGGGILRVKLRSLTNGAITETTFKGADKLEPAQLAYRPAQYLYRDKDQLIFMDNTTYEQTALPASLLGNSLAYLKEDTGVDLALINDQVVNVRLPIKVDLAVTYTEPGFKGDTQSAAMKPATLETGATIQVPLFIKAGDFIKVDTRAGTYVERTQHS